MTTAARCTAAGLTVLAVTPHGAYTAVSVAKTPLSAGGLQALAQRLGSGFLLSQDGRGGVVLWLREERQ